MYMYRSLSLSRYLLITYLRDNNLYTTTNKCLQRLLKNNVYGILNNWCICINISCGISYVSWSMYSKCINISYV